MTEVKERICVDESMLDNRDVGTTWIELPNGQIVEVYPWELAKNVIDNLPDGPKRIALKNQLDELLLAIDAFVDEEM